MRSEINKAEFRGFLMGYGTALVCLLIEMLFRGLNGEFR